MNTTTPKEDDCEDCFGTKQDTSMHSPYPIRKILYREALFVRHRKKPKAN